MTGADRAELTALAGDYALGLMSETEAALFETLMHRDPALAAEVAMLNDRLLPLDLSAPPAALPEGFAERVRARLRAAETGRDPAPGAWAGTEAATQGAANLSWAPWRRRAGLAAALALGVVLGLLGAVQRSVPQPLVVAVLLDDQGQPRAVIEDYGNDTAQIRFVSDVEVPPGTSIEAWTLPSQELGPVSLGVLEAARPSLLRGPDLPRPADAQLYEITLEPLGGSPTGRPTGPIIAKGLAAAQGL
ncbi:anti-sigma factor [Paracoccus sp. (in: a-proteobacteria)]|uniref:anti-sigma factor n=1 Tax=Paracoccus sp. TaxID=267 RepID=UPI00272B4E05|nr:anti-sigma factor [Paracoccus sp. (in: a-proteobacteria)]